MIEIAQEDWFTINLVLYGDADIGFLLPQKLSWSIVSLMQEYKLDSDLADQIVYTLSVFSAWDRDSDRLVPNRATRKEVDTIMGLAHILCDVNTNIDDWRSIVGDNTLTAMPTQAHMYQQYMPQLQHLHTQIGEK
jgi:hypothetical protein